MECQAGGSSPFSNLPGLTGTLLGKLLDLSTSEANASSESGRARSGSTASGRDSSLPAGQSEAHATPSNSVARKQAESIGCQEKAAFTSVIDLASSLIRPEVRRVPAKASLPDDGNSHASDQDEYEREIRRQRRIQGRSPLGRRGLPSSFERTGSIREEDYPHIDNIFMGFVMDDDGRYDSLEMKFRAMITEWQPAAKRLASNKRSVFINRNWLNFENFQRWALRYGYETGARLARRDPDLGWCHDNCVWVGRRGISLWNGKEPPIEYDGISISCSQAVSSGVSIVTYEPLVRRLQAGMPVHDAMNLPPNHSRKRPLSLAGKVTDQTDHDIALKWESMHKSSAIASGKPKVRIDGIPGAVDVSGMRYFADKKRRRRIPENAKICRQWKSFESFRDWAKSSGFERGAKLVRVDTAIGWNPYNCYWSYGKDCDSRDKWPIPSLPAGYGEAGDGDLVDSSGGGVGVAGSDGIRIIRRSRKDAFMVTAFGEVKQLSDWMKDPRCVIGDAGALRARLRSGWVPERAMTEPVGKRGRPRKRSDAGKINGKTTDATS